MAHEDDDRAPRPFQWRKPEVAEGPPHLGRWQVAVAIATIAATLALLGVTVTYAIAGLLAMLHGQGGARFGGVAMCAAPLLLVLPVVAFIQARKGGRTRLLVALGLDAVALAAAVLLGAALETMLGAVGS